MKIGVVLEGGGIKGLYTAGVLDYWMDENLEFQGFIGVSAGAAFGVNYLSKQKGRALTYNLKYNKDPNYMGWRCLLKTGDFFNREFAYERVPKELVPFDDVTYYEKASEIPFYAAVTNMTTGQAEYLRILQIFEQMDILRASASMPFVSTPVPLEGGVYLDGAVADSIPVDQCLAFGYDKLVVVLTKDKDYVRKPISPIMADLFYPKRKYPKFNEALKNRHIVYNNTLERIKELEEKGIAFVLRPSEHRSISRVEKNPEKMQSVYDLGVKDAKETIEALRKFMNS